MNENYITRADELGNIHISEDAISAIAASAASEIDGVAGLMNAGGKKGCGKGVKITITEERAVVDLYVMVNYGKPIPEIAAKVQEAVASAMEAMVGFTVQEVNVHVGGITLAK